MPRHTNGIIIIDKPEGISSAKVVAIVKKVLKVKKAGHTGTLDPFATGLMICCLNSATRIAGFLIKDNKEYEAVLQLGIVTDTGDVTGKIIASSHNIEFSKQKIYSVFKHFKGRIEQVPPAYSALKHKGVPLYKLARQGRPVKKPARNVIINDIRILDINLPEIRFKVACSAGTYIRALASDIGEALGCGGHLKSLTRMRIGSFSINDSLKLDELERLSLTKQGSDILSAGIISMTDALPEIPAFHANEKQTERIKTGGIMTGHDFHYDYDILGNTPVKIVDKKNNIIAIVNYDKNKNTYKYHAVFNNEP